MCTNKVSFLKTQTCKQEYASAGKILVPKHEAEAMGRHEAEAMGRHEAEAMGRQTDLVLDASLPKHKKKNLCNKILQGALNGSLLAKL